MSYEDPSIAEVSELERRNTKLKQELGKHPAGTKALRSVRIITLSRENKTLADLIDIAHGREPKP